MRLLSIDLPWSAADGRFGFAWVEDVRARGPASSEEARGGPSAANAVFERFRDKHGAFDLILLDQPLGGLPTRRYRDVERAFGNSSFVRSGSIQLQCPRFQPGGPHAAAGERLAALAQAEVGSVSAVVVEAFPQLSIPALLLFAQAQGLPVSEVTGLKAHKAGARMHHAQSQLLAALTKWTGCTVGGAALNGVPDAIDALLGLLPVLELFSSAPRAESWAQPVWLHANPVGAPLLPARVSKRLRSVQRAHWMAPLERNECGAPGIRTDGMVALRMPEWPVPQQDRRRL